MSETPTPDAERGYTITRSYDAPRALVWRAISEPQLFARWWCATIPVEVHDRDLKVGGEWHASMTYEGKKMPWSGKFVEIDEPNRLVVAFTDESAGPDVFDLMTYTLADEGAGTLLTVRQSGGHLTDGQYAEARNGTATFLEVLAKVVADL